MERGPDTTAGAGPAPTRRSAASSQQRLQGFQKAAHVDRLRHIGVAAGLADPYLVPSHREGGDGHDRDVAETVILLDPLRDFETGHVGQLNVHHDQIRMPLASEAETDQSFLGLQHLIAVGAEQIMKQLHIELVVLDDENRFHDSRAGTALVAEAPWRLAPGAPGARGSAASPRFALGSSSRAARTAFASCSLVQGLGSSGVRRSGSPLSDPYPGVKPEVNRILMPGRSCRASSAKARPSRPGMTTSV